jgi:hypothetical protein
LRPGVVGARSQLLWDVLAGAYGTLGFDAVGDEAFKALVLARIVEPTSKADTVGVLAEIGVAGPSLRTMFRSLRRAVDGDYRDTLAKPCLVHSAKAGRASLVLYDVTTLHFETEAEDELRRVGMWAILGTDSSSLPRSPSTSRWSPPTAASRSQDWSRPSGRPVVAEDVINGRAKSRHPHLIGWSRRDRGHAGCAGGGLFGLGGRLLGVARARAEELEWP